MKARVTVTLKSGVLDPQGKAIEGALRSLGVQGVASVRQGKVFDIELDGADQTRAEAALKEAADKLLSRPCVARLGIDRRPLGRMDLDQLAELAPETGPPAVLRTAAPQVRAQRILSLIHI